MKAEFTLERAVIGTRKILSITEADYLLLENANRILADSLEFEQRYELLIGNFIAMEVALTELSLRSIIELRHSYSELAQTLQEANRHFANILTAAKAYLDQVVQDFKSLGLDPSFQSLAERLKSKNYDESLEYRFMEAVRNHTQHHAFPITGFHSRANNQDANDWVDSLQVTANKKELFTNKKFKTKFLEGLPDSIDLRFMTREYVRRIGLIHIELRETISLAVKDARNLIEETINNYGQGGEPTLGLCAFKNGTLKEKILIFTNWDDVRLKLSQKNSYAPDLWPRAGYDDPTGEDLKAVRLQRRHSIEQAALAVQISKQSWEQYEAGLRIPFSVYNLYLLQVDQHPTHVLQFKPNVIEITE